jgi:NADPH:quinone reductase-like Zn-dependent oxidoreductase
MQQAIFNHYGDADVIRIVTTDPPRPGRNEVLVRVAAAGLNPKDVLIRKGKFRWLTGRRFPQGIGYDFAGTITDPNGSDFRAGERVFGMVNGLYGRCCAEFVAVRTTELYRLPANLDFVAAAGIALAGQTALQAIRDLGRLQPGQNICINGGSGGVGTLAIQIAKVLGGRVTTVSSYRNTDFCQSLGADRPLAYDRTDLLATPERFAVFFDVFGNYRYGQVAPLLRDRGRYITTVPKSAILKEQFRNLFRHQQAKLVVVKSKASDLQWLAEQLAARRIRPVVDRVYPLAEVSAAQRYLETKRARGKVIIRVAE